VLAKADISTKKMLVITVPPTVGDLLLTKAGQQVPTRFRLRVLAKKAGKKYTTLKWSPKIRAVRAVPPTPVPTGDCNGDGVPNSATDDDDGDLLSDDLERRILTDGCKIDTDGDGVEDGFEYQSAVDLNDDEYQVPNKIVAYPHKMPYPNPGFADANVDYDGDSLTLAQEQALWKYSYSVPGAATHNATRTLTPLSYSDGMQHSLSTLTGPNGRRVPSQPAATYTAAQEFVDWAREAGYLTVDLRTAKAFDNTPNGGVVAGTYDIRDVNLSGSVEPGEFGFTDLDGNGYVSDAERDEDVDGLSNYEELNGRMLPAYWSGCYDEETDYPVSYGGTKFDDADSDGDGIRDGADDQDHDDVPNLMELSRIRASGGLDDRGNKNCTPDEDLATRDVVEPPNPPFDVNGNPNKWGDGKPDVQQYGNHKNSYGRVNPFNPCLPFTDSRTCSHFTVIGGGSFAPFDDSVMWWSLN